MCIMHLYMTTDHDHQSSKWKWEFICPNQILEFVFTEF